MDNNGTALAEKPMAISADLQEKVLLGGDLAKLSPHERLSFLNTVCGSLGLNPLTRPFEYITLNGKLTLYARKDATEQLRKNHKASLSIVSREVTEGIYVVTAKATLPDGRSDESIGAVPIGNLQGDARANAIMKAETKAKRRVTLSICGLGFLDETEVETIPNSSPALVGNDIPLSKMPKEKPTLDALMQMLKKATSIHDIEVIGTRWEKSCDEHGITAIDKQAGLNLVQERWNEINAQK